MRSMCMVEYYHVDECNVNKTVVNLAHRMLMLTAADLVMSQADRMAQAHSCMIPTDTDTDRRTAALLTAISTTLYAFLMVMSRIVASRQM